MSGNSLRLLSFFTGSSTFSMSTAAYIPSLLASCMKESSVSAGASPAATTASAVSSYARSASTFPTSSVFRSATTNMSFATCLRSFITLVPYLFMSGVPTSMIILSLPGSCCITFFALSRSGLSSEICR